MNKIKCNHIDVSNTVNIVLNSIFSEKLKKLYPNKKFTTEEKNKVVEEEIIPLLEDDLVKHNLLLKINSFITNYFEEETYLSFDANSWRKNYLIENNININYKDKRNKRGKEVINKWINYLYENANHFGFYKIKIENLEADDVISLLIKKYSDKQHTIYSNDKDFYQLFKYGNVKIYNPILNKAIEKSELEGLQSLLLKLFIGDISDNIENIISNLLVKNIRFGEKTVLKEIETFITQSDYSKTELEEKIDNIINVFVEKIYTKLTDNIKKIKNKQKKNKEITKEEEYLLLLDLEEFNQDYFFSVMKRNFLINQNMIDFDFIPQSLQDNFFNNYIEETLPSKEEIINFYKTEKLYQLNERLSQKYLKEQKKNESSDEITLYTSYFANIKNIPDDYHLVSIARWNKFFQGEKLPELFPTEEILKKYKNNQINEDEYSVLYKRDVLDKINIEDLKKKLKENTVLLCYEKSEDFCHRHLVKDFLQTKGIDITEFNHKMINKDQKLKNELINIDDYKKILNDNLKNLETFFNFIENNKKVKEETYKQFQNMIPLFLISKNSPIDTLIEKDKLDFLNKILTQSSILFKKNLDTNKKILLENLKIRYIETEIFLKNQLNITNNIELLLIIDLYRINHFIEKIQEHYNKTENFKLKNLLNETTIHNNQILNNQFKINNIDNIIKQIIQESQKKLEKTRQR